MFCEVHRRLDGGRWETELLRDPADRLRLDSVGLDLPLSAVYANVALEVTEPPLAPAGEITNM